jgi:hypothetical protein
MDEISGVYDENDPKIKKRLEYLAQLNAHTRASITCWQDVYDEMKAMCAAYVAQPSPQAASSAIALFCSFILAMEQLPEEGDILVIAQHLNEILIMRNDLTGITVIVDPQEAQTNSLHFLAELLRGLSGGLQSLPEVVPEPAKGRLH